MELAKELCETNMINYYIDNDKILLNNEVWFYINGHEDVFGDNLYNFKTYIDIITNKNEMINAICEFLNTKGVNTKLFEYQGKNVCIDNNAIFIKINNKTCSYYTKYEQFIEFELKIVLKNPLEYYLIDKKQSYKFKSINDLHNVLNQKCTFEQKKCDRNKGYTEDICNNIVNMYKGFPNPYGLCNDESKYMLSSAHGYRNTHNSFSKFYFCSEECMKHFAKYNRCNRCHEDGRGTYFKELGYSLCNGRGDCNPGCVVKYEIEKRYINEDINKQQYKIVVGYNGQCKESNIRLSSDFEELFELIKKNDYRVSVDILTDICYLINTYELRNINNNDNDVVVCSECGCTKHSKKNKDNEYKCYKCDKEIEGEIYYNYYNSEMNGLMCNECCGKQCDYILVKTI